MELNWGAEGCPRAGVRLVYFLKKAVAVDAVTGQVLGSEGQPLERPVAGLRLSGEAGRWTTYSC